MYFFFLYFKMGPATLAFSLGRHPCDAHILFHGLADRSGTNNTWKRRHTQASVSLLNMEALALPPGGSYPWLGALFLFLGFTGFCCSCRLLCRPLEGRQAKTRGWRMKGQLGALMLLGCRQACSGPFLRCFHSAPNEEVGARERELNGGGGEDIRIPDLLV